MSMTAWSSMQAITLASPPHSEQVETSILNTRFRRCAFMPSGAGHGFVALFRGFVFVPLWRPRPLPRLAGVTSARCLLLGANTPWNLVKFTLGLGTSAASLAMKSSGSNTTCVVPSRQGVFAVQGCTNAAGAWMRRSGVRHFKYAQQTLSDERYAAGAWMRTTAGMQEVEQRRSSCRGAASLRLALYRWSLKAIVGC